MRKDCVYALTFTRARVLRQKILFGEEAFQPPRTDDDELVDSSTVTKMLFHVRMDWLPLGSDPPLSKKSHAGNSILPPGKAKMLALPRHSPESDCVALIG
jgi:hypothetical protein